jgi:chorismate mutase / prephenate dehydrogenase
MDHSDNVYQQELENLRARIDAIDLEVVDLLARRRDMVNQVMNLKQSHHLPVYHPAREEDLIYARRQQAKAVGLDPDFIEECYRVILRQSRVTQSGHMARTGIRSDAKVLIVGGYGDMGRYFEKWFSGAGYEVRLMGRSDWPEADVLCAEIDLVIVTVPIEDTADIIRKIAPYLPSCMPC